MWSFPDNPPFAGCILGKKLVIERRIAHAACFNGRNYDRTIVEKNCSCTREDYEWQVILLNSLPVVTQEEKSHFYKHLLCNLLGLLLSPYLLSVFSIYSAFGFHLEESMFNFNQKCIEDTDSSINIHKPPNPCPPGTYYPYSRGYQKIPGDTCQYGQDYRYDPLMYSCPMAGELFDLNQV